MLKYVVVYWSTLKKHKVNVFCSDSRPEFDQKVKDMYRDKKSFFSGHRRNIGEEDYTFELFNEGIFGRLKKYLLLTGLSVLLNIILLYVIFKNH